MTIRWRDLAWAVWKDQWQEILAVLGIITTFATTALPKPVLVALLLVLCALALKVISGIRSAVRTLREKHLPLIVLVGKEEHVADAMWQDIQRAMSRWDFDAERNRRDFDIEREDLFLYHEAPLPTEPGPWLKLARDFRRRIERIGGRLAGRRVFHIFINGPVSLAVGLGASIGTMHEVVVHQWFPGTTESPYHPVADFYTLSSTNPRGMHFLEDFVTGDFRYVQGEGDPSEGKELFVSIWTARDDPRGDVNALARAAREEGRSVSAFHLVQREHRSQETTDDWILCTREILTLLYQRITEQRPERVHLFLSVPVALAFTLGMGIEHFMPVTVYNWWAKERQYFPVLLLDHLGRTVPASP